MADPGTITSVSVGPPLSAEGYSTAAPPRGYDVAALRKQMTAEFAAKFNDVELRKWCVQASAGQYITAESTETRSYTLYPSLQIAEQIYAFVTAKLNEPSAPETSA